MPKKFHGENSKASVARARKEATKQAEVEKKKQEEEDALWKDEDKHALKKVQRKEERDKKKQEVADRKATSKQLLEEEMSSIKSAKPAPSKLTQAQIQSMQEAQAAEKTKPTNVITEMPLEENVNRMVVDGDEARTVEEAIAVLSVGDAAVLDRHPERRLKAAYTAFEEENLPRLKAENPNMRLSQLKQMLKKDWQKSPENPLNQIHKAFNG